MCAEQLKDATGEIGAGRIEDGIVISKGNMFQPRRHDILVESGPSAVLTLKRQEPGQRACRLLASFGRLGGSDELQCHEHHHGVVCIRVKSVFVFEGPAAGLNAWDVDGPVPLQTDFLFLQPRSGPFQRRMVLRQPGFGERERADGCIPDRRKTGLDAKILRVVHNRIRQNHFPLF